MGHIELCFHCRRVASSPKGLPNVEWDWKGIQTILEELALPVGDMKEADYIKLFEEAAKERKAVGEQ